jgi:predicted MFS family arabinose efflux permease
MLFAYGAGSPALLIQAYGFSPQFYNGLLAVNAIAIIIGAVVSSFLVAKLGLDGILVRASVLAIMSRRCCLPLH